jgi:hypothetical protein
MLLLAPVMEKLRRDTKNVMNEPISSARPAPGRWAGHPKCSAMTSISCYVSLPSTPTEPAQPTGDQMPA